MNEGIEVRPSPLGGKGLFATHAFKTGETVLVWDTSHALTQEAFDTLPEDEKKYVCHVEKQMILMQPPARYVNHSCSPNTLPSKIGSDVAIVDIAPGDEITSRYLVTSGKAEPMQCKCGAKDCKGLLRDY